MSDFYFDEGRRASKNHSCSECNAVIEKGVQYTHASGRWDGAMWSAKWCGRCASVREAACRYANYDSEECPSIPGLAQWLLDSFGELASDKLKTNADIIEAGGRILADEFTRRRVS